MCGIFGYLIDKGITITNKELEKTIRLLLRYSQVRGQEASGIAYFDAETVLIRKRALPGRQFAKSPEFQSVFTIPHRCINNPLVCFGHARLDTNSSKLIEEENSPLRCGDIIGVHLSLIHI